MVHAADFGCSRDQRARSSARLQMLANEAGASDVKLRRGWAVFLPIDGVGRRPGELRRASALATTDQSNKNFHACFAMPASLGHNRTSDDTCRMVETAPIDVLHLERVVADISTNVIDAGEVRVTGRIRQGRGCT